MTLLENIKDKDILSLRSLFLKNVTTAVILEFLQNTTDLGYNFEYITADMDRCHISAGSNINSLVSDCI